MKKLTIKEIAKMANVSPTAVSFVINGKPGVSEETRIKIQKIIQQEHFIPSLSSRRLVNKRSYNICFLFSQAASPFVDLFYWSLARGLLDVCNAMSLNLVLADQSAGGAQDTVPDVILQKDVDAVICFQRINEAVRAMLRESRVPYVIIDAHNEREGDVCVKGDYRLTARAAVRFLCGLGFQRIGFLGSAHVPEYYQSYYSGYVDALAEVGLALTPAHVKCHPSDPEGGYALMTELLDGNDLPEAIVCTSDLLAVGAMKAAKQRGLRVPGDISFVGTDDLVIARYADPALTTIRIDPQEMSAAAMQLILRMIQGEAAQTVYVQSDQLIIRESTQEKK